ncbi:MAG TPA: helix-turn-helix transcriptional regulator [Gemmatimonadales bacterium]|nr:helix-turn-helix transcriptional regulator [Gemmatimonadales bacterium]
MTSHQMPNRPVPVKSGKPAGVSHDTEVSREAAAADAPDEAGTTSRSSSRRYSSRGGSPGVRLLRNDEWKRAERVLHLSGREAEIARAIFADRTKAEIAEDLGISHHTVHTHVERLYRKLGVGSRTQLVLCVVRQGIGR